jgi:hypothetical protein
MVTATAKKPVQTVDSHPAVEAAWAVFAAATARYQAMCGTVEDVDGAVSEKAARHFLAGGALEDEAVVRANARGLLVAKAACDLARSDYEAAKEQARADRPEYAAAVEAIAQAFEDLAVAVRRERQLREDLQDRDLFLQKFILCGAPPNSIATSDVTHATVGYPITEWVRHCVAGGLLDGEWKTRLL